MIKKSIASILIVLIFINSIGCTSYRDIKKEDKNEIEKAMVVKVTTVDDKEYILTNVTVIDSVISGNRCLENKIMERRIEFPVDQIAKIEVEKKVKGSIGLLVGIAVIGIGVYLLISKSNSKSTNSQNRDIKWIGL